MLLYYWRLYRDYYEDPFLDFLLTKGKFKVLGGSRFFIDQWRTREGQEHIHFRVTEGVQAFEGLAALGV